LELIFSTKSPDKIIIVSDSVKETKVKGRVKAVTDTRGKLHGGSMTIIESTKRLIQMGFDEDMIMRCITTNPQRYLSM
jgi:N-acetylglucosamine-6-phosphate deacetylase